MFSRLVIGLSVGRAESALYFALGADSTSLKVFFFFFFFGWALWQARDELIALFGRFAEDFAPKLSCASDVKTA